MIRLLLIEDDDETAEEVAGYFRDRGYLVDRAATGPDGLAQAGSGRADVMVVDRLLPGIDGLSVIEALRRAGVRTPAMVLSALDGVDERVRGLRAGGDDYLAKPFALPELAARIEALLRRPSTGRRRCCGSVRSNLTWWPAPPGAGRACWSCCRGSSGCWNT